MACQLATDLEAIVSRRRALGLIGLGMGGLAAACSDGLAAHAAESAKCLATPTEIRGPFPADGSWASGRTLNVFGKEGLVRSDIRSSFAGMNGFAEGARLDCAIELVDGAGCAPLAGHALYIWQCDAAGDYSLYNRRDANYLRGLRMADGDGVVRFTTIVPGCYGGRCPHIHLEVFESLEAATGGRGSRLVTQLALPEAECAETYRTRREYGDSLANLRRWPVARDFAFADASPAGLAAQTIGLSGNPERGYSGEATVALA